ncbi:MAG TPA: hypothetical protein VGE93_02330 [Bryobacteraceae bacterium]
MALSASYEMMICFLSDELPGMEARAACPDICVTAFPGGKRNVKKHHDLDYPNNGFRLELVDTFSWLKSVRRHDHDLCG